MVFCRTDLLSTFSASAQIRLSLIPWFFGSSLGRQYAIISAANSTAIPNVGRSKNTFGSFVGVVLIASVIIIHAALCRCCSSDVTKAIFILTYHAIAAYVILRLLHEDYKNYEKYEMFSKISSQIFLESILNFLRKVLKIQYSKNWKMLRPLNWEALKPDPSPPPACIETGTVYARQKGKSITPNFRKTLEKLSGEFEKNFSKLWKY